MSSTMFCHVSTEGGGVGGLTNVGGGRGGFTPLGKPWSGRFALGVTTLVDVVRYPTPETRRCEKAEEAVLPETKNDNPPPALSSRL